MAEAVVTEVDRTKLRPFTLGDAMILVIALGARLGGRPTWHRTYRKGLAHGPAQTVSDVGRGRLARMVSQPRIAQLPILPAARLPDPAAQTPPRATAFDDRPARLRRLCRARRLISHLPTLRTTRPLRVCPTSNGDYGSNFDARRRAADLGHLDRNAPLGPRAELDRPLGPRLRCLVDDLCPRPHDSAATSLLIALACPATGEALCLNYSSRRQTGA